MPLYVRHKKTDKLKEIPFDSQKIKYVALSGAGFSFYKTVGRPLHIDNQKIPYSPHTWYVDRLPLFWQSFSLLIDGWWQIETKGMILVLNPLFYGVNTERLKQESYNGSLLRMVNGKWVVM